MNKLLDINSLKKLDYSEIGLKCGIEIHQQLDTGKLFCPCPCNIVSNEELDKEIQRELRFSQGETGEVDRAAQEEILLKKRNHYRYNDKVACLVELDEEPPSKPNQIALDTVFKVGTMLNMNFVDKIHFMRKTIVDGSVTTGFQRTALLGISGELETKNCRVNIEGINIEEDSCRAISREQDHTVFSLDRQGIPLIEITTGPQIKTPEQAQEVAKELGNILRSFKETKRGLGTIRQDLNVSIEGGARVEIKGAQNLKLIPEIVEAEAKRQLIYKSILDYLKSKKIIADTFSDFEIYDITECFNNTTSKVIKSNLTDEECGVYAIKLFGLKGVLGLELQKGHRFASEISDRNKKRFSKIKGLFHLDEMPNYGITKNEVDEVIKKLDLSKEDNFIMLAGDKELVKLSLNYILKMLSELLSEIPSEVRQVDPKGTLTKYLRPMPGAARMYPETDVKDISIEDKYLEEMKKNLPEKYDTRLQRLENELNIERNKIEDFLEDFEEDQVKQLLKESDKSASALYNIIFDIPKDIKKRDNIETYNFKYNLLLDLARQIKSNNFNQKVIRDLFLSLYKEGITEVSDLNSYIKEKGLLVEEANDSEIEAKVKEIIKNNKGAPFGALMGIAMKEFKGSVDGKKLSSIIKKLS